MNNLPLIIWTGPKKWDFDLPLKRGRVQNSWITQALRTKVSFFQKIQNQQKVGVQVCILSPFIQMISKIFENSVINCIVKLTLKNYIFQLNFLILAIFMKIQTSKKVLLTNLILQKENFKGPSFIKIIKIFMKFWLNSILCINNRIFLRNYLNTRASNANLYSCLLLILDLFEKKPTLVGTSTVEGLILDCSNVLYKIGRCAFGDSSAAFLAHCCRHGLKTRCKIFVTDRTVCVN